MKLVLTSDLHGKLPDISPCDVLIVAGDVCPNWDHSRPYQRSWLETNFSSWLNQVPARIILGIGGNHDFALKESSQFAHNLPWIYLLDQDFEWHGIKFWGFPWVPNLARWAFHLDDHALDEKLKLIPNDTDVVIAHGPPWGLCDKTVPKFGACHAGFPGTSHMLERVRPLIYVCGHIHEGYGSAITPQGTIVMNVSHQTENYEPINAPVEAYFGEDRKGLNYALRPTHDPSLSAFLDLAY